MLFVSVDRGMGLASGVRFARADHSIRSPTAYGLDELDLTLSARFGYGSRPLSAPG